LPQANSKLDNSN